jgi:hypothetical protein
MDDALRLAKLITRVLDVVNELWPCPGEFISTYDCLAELINVESYTNQVQVATPSAH